MMIVKKVFLFLGAVLCVCVNAGAQQQDEFKRFGYKEFETFVPEQISSTGVPVCDAYFSQLEVCMKRLLPPANYPDLEVGLTEAKQAVVFDAGNDPEGVARRCQEAMSAAKAAYTSQGCTFN